jgi:protein subunit release factor B
MRPRLDPAQVLSECREDRYRASGPGGQHRNKVETAVRLLHLPSGLIATSGRLRSLEQNRRAALERLVERLEARLYVAPPRVETKPTRGSVRRRLGEKKRASERKSGRRVRGDEH